MDKKPLFHYQFAALRGVQAGRPYYVTMCPMSLIPKIFLFDEEELPPEFRAQRQVDRRRVPEIAKYIVENIDNYAFSSITASVDGDVQFEAVTPGQPDVGRLKVPMNSRFVINDGQHRRAAIEMALQDCPELRDETISVVLFPDGDLARSQQLFADLNKYAVRPTASISILYDRRNDMSDLSRQLSREVSHFRGLTEMERTSVSGTSRKLFTLSAIHQATGKLLGKTSKTPVDDDDRALALKFWTEIGNHMPDWIAVREGRLNAAELRREQIQCYGLALQALAHVGKALTVAHPDDWHRRLAPLRTVDWARSNPLWEGRALIAGRLSKARANVILTANIIKKQLDLELSEEDQKMESIHGR